MKVTEVNSSRAAIQLSLEAGEEVHFAGNHLSWTRGPLEISRDSWKPFRWLIGLIKQGTVSSFDSAQATSSGASLCLGAPPGHTFLPVAHRSPFLIEESALAALSGHSRCSQKKVSWHKKNWILIEASDCVIAVGSGSLMALELSLGESLSIRFSGILGLDEDLQSRSQGKRSSSGMVNLIGPGRVWLASSPLPPQPTFAKKAAKK